MNTIVDISDKAEYTIDGAIKPGQSKMPCPKCGPTRSKPNDKSLSYNKEKGVGTCHHCQTKFKNMDSESTYAQPVFKNSTQLSDRVVKWFDSRGILQETLDHMKISEGNEYMPQTEKKENTIHFNYFRNGKLINVKYRDAKKNFKMVKGAEKIPFNCDGIKGQSTIIICEGEMDALTLIQCGYPNTMSVPNGATTGVNNMDYLDSVIETFEQAEEIILCTDNDPAGVNLRTQLAARLGPEKCSKVTYPSGVERECKDINEVLMKFGKHKVIEVIEQRQPMPIEGIFTAEDYQEELINLFENGLPPGLTINNPLDKHLSFEPGRLYLVTGIPGHGKSEFLDFIIERLISLHKLKVGYFSPENHPIQLHISKLVEKITVKRFIEGNFSKDEFDAAIKYMNKNYFFIDPPQDYTIATILEKARYLVLRKGIKIFVIDPWNKIEHQIPAGQTETNYVSQVLDKIITFAKRNQVILFLVAHPRKMNKNDKKYEVPTLYDISGSANFYNKTDFGFCVYRDFESGVVSVHVQKVKFKHLGSEGVVHYTYDRLNGRYIPYDPQLTTIEKTEDEVPF